VARQQLQVGENMHIKTVVFVASATALTGGQARADGCWIFDRCPDLFEEADGAVNDACRDADTFAAIRPQASAFSAQDGTDYYGAAFDITLVAWRHPQPYPGPSHGEITFGGTYHHAANREPMATLEGGLRFTPERSAARSWIIPFVGIRLGRTIDLETKSDAALSERWFVLPSIGLYPFWFANTRNAWLLAMHVEAGYQVASSHDDQISGLRLSVGITGAAW
jgi:hypothetical protein